MTKNTNFSAEADAVFFDSYDNLAVHEKMNKDEIRTKSYLDAIENNPHLFEGKVVLDNGTGTGILSMYVSRAWIFQANTFASTNEGGQVCCKGRREARLRHRCI